MREAAEASTADPELASEEFHEVSYPEGRILWRGLDAAFGADAPQEDEDALSSTGSDFSHITIEAVGPRWIGSLSEWQERNLKPITNRIRARWYGPNVIRHWRRFTRRRRCLRALLALRLCPNGLTLEPGVLEHVARYLF